MTGRNRHRRERLGAAHQGSAWRSNATAANRSIAPSRRPARRTRSPTPPIDDGWVALQGVSEEAKVIVETQQNDPSRSKLGKRSYDEAFSLEVAILDRIETYEYPAPWRHFAYRFFGIEPSQRRKIFIMPGATRYIIVNSFPDFMEGLETQGQWLLIQERKIRDHLKNATKFEEMVIMRAEQIQNGSSEVKLVSSIMQFWTIEAQKVVKDVKEAMKIEAVLPVGERKYVKAWLAESASDGVLRSRKWMGLI